MCAHNSGTAQENAVNAEALYGYCVLIGALGMLCCV